MHYRLIDTHYSFQRQPKIKYSQIFNSIDNGKIILNAQNFFLAIKEGITQYGPKKYILYSENIQVFKKYVLIFWEQILDLQINKKIPINLARK